MVQSQYELEQSKDGHQFKTLPQVQAAVGKPRGNYKTIDEQPTLGTSFYRVKYISPNGDYVHSPIMQVYVTPEGAPIFLAYPNPFGKLLTVDFLSPLAEVVTLVVLDNLGQVVYQSTIPAGVLRKELNLPEAAKGLLTLQIITKKERIIKKLMKTE